MNKNILDLEKIFIDNSDDRNAIPMARYMKNRFGFLGLQNPQRKELQKYFLLKENLPELSELDEIARYLWKQPYREFQYFAIDLLKKYQQQTTPEFIELYEWMIINKSWWDTVDLIAARLIGDHFLRFPDQVSDKIFAWMKSDNIWLQRTCLLFQLRYKDKTDQMLMGRIIMKLNDQTEFFTQKAIGWALREYSKTDRSSVINFVENNPLSKLSKREALKWIKNH